MFVPRVFYVALGATAGVLLVRRVQASLAKVTPSGLADRASASAQDAGDRAQGWWSQVRGYASEREVELRAALGLDEGAGAPGVEPGGVARPGTQPGGLARSGVQPGGPARSGEAAGRGVADRLRGPGRLESGPGLSDLAPGQSDEAAGRSYLAAGAALDPSESEAASRQRRRDLGEREAG